MPMTGDLLSTTLAALAFIPCALTSAAPPSGSQPQPRRREVVVKGKRVKTIDVHAHCIVPAAAAVINHPLEAPGLLMQDTSTRIAAMDAQGIDVEALSINPYWYRADRDAATQLIKVQNETLVEFCAANPERFVAFATAALQFPDLAAQQVEHAVKTLGFRGVSVGGSVAGEELANPKFHPFWAKCEELDALLFMHPQDSAVATGVEKRLRGKGYLDNTIGNPLETTIALSHLIFEGTFDRFPKLRICAAHGGGYLASYADRSDAVCETFPFRCKDVTLKKKPTEYLKQIYVDSLVFTPEALRHLAAVVGPDHVMVGTDYGFNWSKDPVSLVMSTPELSPADKEAILGGTAAKLLRLPG